MSEERVKDGPRKEKGNSVGGEEDLMLSPKSKTSRSKPSGKRPVKEAGNDKPMSGKQKKSPKKGQAKDEGGRSNNSSSRPRSRIVNLRVPTQIVDDMDYWVDRRRYKSRSEFILAAIRFYLDYIEYRESYNVRTFQRGQLEETPSERFERLQYLRGRP